jgi:hypothetical protein
MKRNRISEATGSGNAGNFRVPIVLSPQPWTEDQVAPFTNPVYSYNNAELAYEEADGDFKETPEERARIEKRTDRISQVDRYLKSFYTGQNDEDGSNIGNIENPEKIIRRAVGPLKEDLAVWFGKKKAPKGSSQPKGPWVNICRKKEGGGHPPCGRPDADPKGYPKCRAAGVAAKMTDSQKRSACSQKRREEKKDPKIGKGNKPTMVSYKPKNESMKKTIRLTENDLIRMIKKVIKEQTEPKKGDYITLKCVNPNPKNSSGKIIDGVEYSDYLENSQPLSDKLILQRPSGLPSDEVFSSGGENDTYTINIELIEDDVLKRALNVTDDNTYIMTYNVGGRFYCSPKTKLSPTWESFFKEKNITF